MEKSKLLTGPWTIADYNKGLIGKPRHGKKVFSCFHCGGGGSSWGYKLAGYDVLGGVEIDPKMAELYKTNHNPKYPFVMGIKEFNELPRKSIPNELFDLDILDGSPPCSSFSMAGSREQMWGKEKKFREGQTAQVLDDLFFDFIATAKMLKPKIVVAENVKGLMIGNARGYIKWIHDRFQTAGYDVQLFLLNAAFMGVPQRRERTFFIARQRDLNFAPIELKFNEPTIPLKNAFSEIDYTKHESRPLTAETERLWRATFPGKSLSTVHAKGSRFNAYKTDGKQPTTTLTSSGEIFHFEEPRHLYDDEYKMIQSFPMDYDFLNQKVKYVCGMSVPPFMMQRVSAEIYKQWLAPKVKLKKTDKREINVNGK